MINIYAGIKIVVDNNLVKRKQIRFPKTKRKRILKKWAKRSSSYRNQLDLVAYKISKDTFVCHPAIANEIRQYFRDKGYVGMLPITS